MFPLVLVDISVLVRTELIGQQKSNERMEVCFFLVSMRRRKNNERKLEHKSDPSIFLYCLPIIVVDLNDIYQSKISSRKKIYFPNSNSFIFDLLNKNNNSL